MLTRIEIDGFKTFREFSLDLTPFTVLIGKNAAGKSNLLDALQLLRDCASRPVGEAVLAQRGEPSELLHVDDDGRRDQKISLAAEVLLPPSVRDPYGQEVPVSRTRVRYELRLEARETPGGGRRWVVRHEAARFLRKSEDPWPALVGASAAFGQRYLRYVGGDVVFMETTDDGDGHPVFRVRQQGKAGRPRVVPAVDAEASVLSSITTAEFPISYALRRELQSWDVLQLDPATLRRPASLDGGEELSRDGSNLAAALARLQRETRDEHSPRGALAELSLDLSRVVPDVLGVEVERDDARREWDVVVQGARSSSFSARVASDGTLRVLALLTALYDTRLRGLLAFEEPENGITPARLRHLVELLGDLVAQPRREDLLGSGADLAQVLVTSHSPVVVAAAAHLRDAFVVYADLATRTDGGRTSRVTSLRQVVTPERDALIDMRPLSPSEMRPYEVADALAA